MPLPVNTILGAQIFSVDNACTYYVRRIEFVGELGETQRVRLYASAPTASRVHGDDRDEICDVDWDTGVVTLNVEETKAFRRGEPFPIRERKS